MEPQSYEHETEFHERFLSERVAGILAMTPALLTEDVSYDITGLRGEGVKTSVKLIFFYTFEVAGQGGLGFMEKASEGRKKAREGTNATSYALLRRTSIKIVAFGN